MSPQSKSQMRPIDICSSLHPLHSRAALQKEKSIEFIKVFPARVDIFIFKKKSSGTPLESLGVSLDESDHVLSLERNQNSTSTSPQRCAGHAAWVILYSTRPFKFQDFNLKSFRGCRNALAHSQFLGCTMYGQSESVLFSKRCGCFALLGEK